MTESYDVAVIGAGPAGYVAAIRCAQLGLKTVCVDRWTDASGKAALGGTCLNVGCIPSKALLDSTERYHNLRHTYSRHGIVAENVTMNVATMMKRKARIVRSLTMGIAGLLRANKIKSIHAHGRLAGNRTVELLDAETNVKTGELTANHIILASGSTPIELASLKFQEDMIVDSAGALSFHSVPEKLGIVGAGVIGLELGSVWNRLGSEVTILEALDDFLATADHEISAEAAKAFRKQKLNIQLGARVESATVRNNMVDIAYTVDGQRKQLAVNRLIVCVGRRPYTDNLFTEESGVQIDERGFIRVDENCLTDAPGVYAIGDSVRGPMLAHKGSEEGIAVAERIANGYGHINYFTIPWVIYTSPEIAWVGLTENQVKDSGAACRTGKFPFSATGRAKAMEETAGFVKIVADASTDEIKGVHIFGPHASELIAEAVVAMEYRASSEDLARTIHAHPTLSEAIHEAALALDGRAIHWVN